MSEQGASIPASVSPKIVTVVGGTGFAGRRLVTRRVESGAHVRIVARHHERPGDAGSFCALHCEGPARRARAAETAERAVEKEREHLGSAGAGASSAERRPSVDAGPSGRRSDGDPLAGETRRATGGPRTGG